MTTNIQLLRSSIPNKRPDPVMLLEGQAAVNIAPDAGSPGLYFALTDDSLVKVGPVAFHPINPPNSIAAGHPGNSIGEEWMDTNPSFFQPVEKVYNGSRWVTSSGFLVNDDNGDFTLSKTMYLRTMEASGKAQYSYIRVPQDNFDGRRLIDAQPGMLRFNNDANTLKYEGYDGKSWVEFATTNGTSTLEGLLVNGNIESTGNVDLCSDCRDDFRVRGEALFDCGVSVDGGVHAKGNGIFDGPNVEFNTNLTDTTYVKGQLVAEGDSEFKRSLTIGRVGATNKLIANCPSFLLNDTTIGEDETHHLKVQGTAEFLKDTKLRNDVTIGDTISNVLLVNSTAKFRGHVELGDPVGNTNLDVYSTTTFLKDAFFQENVTVGSDQSDLLNVKATANLLNNTNIGTQDSDTLTVLATTTVAADASFTENVTVGSDPFDLLKVNATTEFNTSVRLGLEQANVIHVKGTPKFYETLVPSGNLAANLGATGTRFGELYVHDGNVSGKLTVHELEVIHTTSFATDFEIGFNELHDLKVKATALFNAPVGFERDVFIGDEATDILDVGATSTFRADVALRETLYVENLVTVNDNIVPNIDDSYTLGTTVRRWTNIHSKDGAFTGTVSIDTLAPLNHTIQADGLIIDHNAQIGTDDLDDLVVDATLRQNSAAFFGDDVTIGDEASDELFVNSKAYFYEDAKIGKEASPGTTTLDVYSTPYFYTNIYPDADASVDVGSSVQRWKDMYALNAYLTNNLEVGSNCSDSLTVHATSLFKCDSTTEGNVTLNNASDQLTNVKGVLTSEADVNLNSHNGHTTTVNGLLDSKSNVILNTDCVNTTTIKGKLTAECDTTINGDLNLVGGADLASGVILNSSCSDTTLIKGVLDTRCDVDLCATNAQKLTVRGDQHSQVNVTLNSNCSHRTDILGELFSVCDVTLNTDENNTTTVLGVLDAKVNVFLNSSCSDLTNIKGLLTTDCEVILNDKSGNTTNRGNLTVEKDLTVNQKSYLEQRVTCGGNVIPKVNNSVDLGTSSNRWRNIYTNDMHFSNMDGKANDVDGTNGNWTLQEGKNDLFLINNLTGAKFRISMEPVG